MAAARPLPAPPRAPRHRAAARRRARHHHRPAEGVPAVRTVIVLLFTVAGLAVPTPAARAGTYDVWSCQLANGRPAPVAGWKDVAFGAPPPSNQCATGRGMRAEFQVSSLTASSHVGWWFEAPPGSAITAYELYRSARVGNGSDGSARAFGLYHDEPRFDPTATLIEFCTPNPQQCTQVGDPLALDPMDPDNRVARSSLRIKRLILRMECRSINGPVDCGPADPGGGTDDRTSPDRTVRRRAPRHCAADRTARGSGRRAGRPAGRDRFSERRGRGCPAVRRRRRRCHRS